MISRSFLLDSEALSIEEAEKLTLRTVGHIYGCEAGGAGKLSDQFHQSVSVSNTSDPSDMNSFIGKLNFQISLRSCKVLFQNVILNKAGMLPVPVLLDVSFTLHFH